MRHDSFAAAGILISGLWVGTAAIAASATPDAATETAHNGCYQVGPQTPRDIDNPTGTNPVLFPIAPDYKQLNLCNIHFHANAEHRAKAFAIRAPSEPGIGGYQCSLGENLTASELQPVKKPVCEGIKSGDTIEVHWVHTSCNVAPGPTLGACLSKNCANPTLRVETQVFTLVNDPAATNFADLDYAGARINGYHQAKSIPQNTGQPVEFLGSTTGPSYNNQNTCSPYQVTWSVRPSCAKLDINSLHAWCENNVFDEDHAHKSRLLVEDPALLSEIN
ncbi:MAG: delta-class carbonic anhydrase [Pseudomonadota bacterium]